MRKRVVITGMGTINPLGLSVEETWTAVLAGKSGVGPITRFDASDLQVQIACEVKNFDPEDYMDGRQARRSDQFQQYALGACEEAVKQAGIEWDDLDRTRVAVVVSSAVGGLDTILESVSTLVQKGPRRVNPFTIPMIMANGAAGLIAIKYGVQGPSYSISSACASGADSLGQAAMLIRAGIADVVLAGSSESTINRMGISTFDRMGALARRTDSYENTPAPFDKNRDGFVMGEGAAVLVLESLASAQERGADILAELAGHAATADANHITAPLEDGSGAAQAIRAALLDAGLNPGDVDYINAHGTGTHLNDVAETRAIRKTFGSHADLVPISSTKSMTGHMMGATGALEAIFCVLAIQKGVIPPTIHLHTPDPECDLDYVPLQARKHSVRVALSNSLGFGGHNATLALKAFS